LNNPGRFELGRMDPYQAHAEQALVVMALSTATLVACLVLLMSMM
jgi:hypothetical protein